MKGKEDEVIRGTTLVFQRGGGREERPKKKEKKKLKKMREETKGRKGFVFLFFGFR